ncbi:MAG: L-seryl-tRNA(Sec) selenium transferase [Dermatophilaceae bacterium]
MPDDPRHLVPRTDRVLDDPRLSGTLATVHRDVVRHWVRRAQERVRTGVLDPDAVVETVLDAATPRSARVINGTGVIVHTNLGRAPLADEARRALEDAAGCTPLELDLATGRRGRRAPGVTKALLARVGEAEDALVVGNGAAAVLLAVTSLAGGRDVVVSRGELVEIGDGFRLPELLTTTGARLVEVGTTNRTRIEDYAEALSPHTGCILKVHPANFRMSGFTASVPVHELVRLEVPVVVDIGSGLLTPHPALPDEPDAAGALTAGADIVTCSGDKLLGGPQAGILLGRSGPVARARRHPLARALRPGKLSLAALEATLLAPTTPVLSMLTADEDDLRRRAEHIAAQLPGDVTVTSCESVVGGGGAPEVVLASAGLALRAEAAPRLRSGDPAVLARTREDRCVIDLRTVRPDDDGALVRALRAAVPAG